ncbi:LOW QUALITY PROTEIN: hypothetical protein HID58_034354, partial [Brassica napus]
YNNQLRVLDDTEKGNWSKHFWNIKSVWGTDTCEIVWVKWPWIKPCYVYYYNVERQSVRRVYIQGIDDKVDLISWHPPIFDMNLPNTTNSFVIIKIKVLTDVREMKILWRKIEIGFLHFPETNQNGIYINGILCYISLNKLTYVIACFDEESSVLISFLMLINYKRQLGALVFDDGDFELSWPKDQSEKLIRAKLFGRQVLGPINFMFSTTMWRDRISIEIKGIEEKLMCRDALEPIFIFTNHVENLMMRQ